MIASGYHVPVLLEESISGLNIKPDGVYVDLTLGGGGHSQAILSHLRGGTLIAFDQDPDAGENIPNDDRVTFVRNNFRFFKNYLRYLHYPLVDGILADLGVSSHHFEKAARGFSFHEDNFLDMRMNPEASLTAHQFIKEAAPEHLLRVFTKYGEIKNARALVRSIVDAREKTELKTVKDFTSAIQQRVDPSSPSKYLAKVFQALRIEVNQEIEVLGQMLKQIPGSLKKEGRVSIISYHSLEDRLVKNLVKTGNIEGKIEKDFHGNVINPLRAVHKKVIQPSAEEIKKNKKARSAKLRVAEKI